MRQTGLTFARLTGLPEAITLLAGAARAEGFRFVDRLVAEFQSGQNRFSDEGEVLLGAFKGELLVGVGGLNRDPYGVSPDAPVGRVRRLYVLPEYRGQGVGGVILGAIEKEAVKTFTLLRLFTDSSAAASFYEGRGYMPVDAGRATHVKRL